MTKPASDSAMARLAAVGDVVLLPKCDEASLIEAAGAADALVVRTYSLINARVIAAAIAKVPVSILSGMTRWRQPCSSFTP